MRCSIGVASEPKLRLRHRRSGLATTGHAQSPAAPVDGRRVGGDDHSVTGSDADSACLVRRGQRGRPRWPERLRRTAACSVATFAVLAVLPVLVVVLVFVLVFVV